MLDKPGAGAGHSVMQSWEAGFSCGKEARFMELPPMGFLLFSSLLVSLSWGPPWPSCQCGWLVCGLSLETTAHKAMASDRSCPQSSSVFKDRSPLSMLHSGGVDT